MTIKKSQKTDRFASPAKAEPSTVEVVLKKVHTHAGVTFQKGASLNVTPAQRDWLAEREIV